MAELAASSDNGGISDRFKFLLLQYNRQIDYARGINEKLIGTLFVFLGLYYGHLRNLGSADHKPALLATVIGSLFVVMFYYILCRKNAQRCWASYACLQRAVSDEDVTLDEIGIVEDEPKYAVWAWFGGFIAIYAIFFCVEIYLLLKCPP